MLKANQFLAHTALAHLSKPCCHVIRHLGRGDIHQLASEGIFEMSDNACFTDISFGSEAGLLVGEELVGNVLKGIPAHQHFTRFQLALLAHLPPFIGTEGYSLIMVLDIRGRLAHTAPRCINVGNPPRLTILPPVQPVTLSLLWHVCPLYFCEVSFVGLPHVRPTTASSLPAARAQRTAHCKKPAKHAWPQNTVLCS